jgi:hypothetical protein
MIAKMRVGQNANAETMYQDKGCYDGGISYIRCEREEQRVMAFCYFGDAYCGEIPVRESLWCLFPTGDVSVCFCFLGLVAESVAGRS